MSGRRYTAEQLEQVKRANSLTDYYDILEVSVTCSTNEIAKSYRNLALKLHPDKNSAPGATEATKAMNRAFEVLSNPLLRSKYDEIRLRFGNQSGEWNRRFDDDDDDSDDYDEEEEMIVGLIKIFHSWLKLFMKFLIRNLKALLSLAVVVSLICYSTSFEAAYSFVRTSEYRNLRTTRTFGVRYYVKRGFMESKGHVLEDFGLIVEREYIDMMENTCILEINKLEHSQVKAESVGDRTTPDDLETFDPRSCEELQTLMARKGVGMT